MEGSSDPAVRALATAAGQLLMPPCFMWPRTRSIPSTREPATKFEGPLCVTAALAHSQLLRRQGSWVYPQSGTSPPRQPRKQVAWGRGTQSS